MKCICCVLLAVGLANGGRSQTREGRVVGKVTDENGLPLAGARLSFIKLAGSTTSDEKGNFLLKVPLGVHLLRASLAGYPAVELEVEVTGSQGYVPVKLALEERRMEEIIIEGEKTQSASATRTLVPIANIPQAITVVGQEVFRRQAAIDLASISRNIIGLNFTGNYSGAGSAQFFNARGFDLSDSQNYRWNGVMVWNWGNHYADNIEQVEFLKGPTSILFGDVAPGGVMNFMTKKPLARFQAHLDVKTGSWGLVRPALDITGPITANRRLRYRVNTSYERSDSFRNRVSSKRKFVSTALAWDITPKLTVELEGVFKQSKATDDAGLVSPDGSIAGLDRLDPSLYLGEPSREFLYTDRSYFATLSYEINPTWRIKAISFYGSSANRPFGLWFDPPDEHGDFVRKTYGFFQKARNHTLSGDLFGTFYTGPVKHQLVFGAEIQSTGVKQTNGGELDSLDVINLYLPEHGQTRSPDPLSSPMRPYISRIDRAGLHIQDQLMFFSERLHLLLGLRLGRTRQGNDYIENELPGTAYQGYADDRIAKNVITPRVGALYKTRDGHVGYASFTKGYEINSPDLFAQNYLEYASPPATLSTQLEMGLKMHMWARKVTLALTAFKIDKRRPYGYVYLDADNPDYDRYNVYYDGHHQSKGVELEAEARIGSDVTFTGGMGFTRAKVISDPGYPAGNALPNAPGFVANGWLRYEPSGRWHGFHVSTGVFFKSSFYSSLLNDELLKIPPSYTLDAAIGYTYKSAGLQFNVNNMTNQVSYLNPWQFNLFDVKPLRQFIISLNYRLQGKR